MFVSNLIVYLAEIGEIFHFVMYFINLPMAGSSTLLQLASIVRLPSGQLCVSGLKMEH